MNQFVDNSRKFVLKMKKKFLRDNNKLLNEVRLNQESCFPPDQKWSCVPLASR